MGPASYILYDNQIRSYIQANGGIGHSRRKHTRRGSDDYGWNSAGDRQPHGDGLRHDPGPGKPREGNRGGARVPQARERRGTQTLERRKRTPHRRDAPTDGTAAGHVHRTFSRYRGHRTAEPIKLTKLTDDDDIESYLTTFERIMAANEVSRERWSFQLARHLTGKAQQAYAALPPDEAKTYNTVKEAILRRYDINGETYRQRFRKLRPREGESPQELITRLKDLATRWARESKSRDELTVREEFLSILPEDARP